MVYDQAEQFDYSIARTPLLHKHLNSALFCQVPGKVIKHEEVTAYISFNNPLPVTLKGGVFTVEGAGLLSAREIPVM